jgi:hypothetical protein
MTSRRLFVLIGALIGMLSASGASADPRDSVDRSQRLDSDALRDDAATRRLRVPSEPLSIQPPQQPTPTKGKSKSKTSSGSRRYVARARAEGVTPRPRLGENALSKAALSERQYPGHSRRQTPLSQLRSRNCNPGRHAGRREFSDSQLDRLIERYAAQWHTASHPTPVIVADRPLTVQPRQPRYPRRRSARLPERRRAAGARSNRPEADA